MLLRVRIKILAFITSEYKSLKAVCENNGHEKLVPWS